MNFLFEWSSGGEIPHLNFSFDKKAQKPDVYSRDKEVEEYSNREQRKHEQGQREKIRGEEHQPGLRKQASQVSVSP